MYVCNFVWFSEILCYQKCISPISYSPICISNVNSSEIVAECLKMFGVIDIAEVVATRKDRFVQKYVLNSEICTICS